MKESYLSTLLQLRLIVGFLGERAQCAWWPTAFYEASSRQFLEPVFPRRFASLSTTVYWKRPDVCTTSI